MHLLFLSNAVGAIHSLQIYLRIPVAVIQDDNVGRLQIYS
jgi:hypothetical protein